MPSLWVMIPVAGRWPTAEELTAQDAVMAALSAAGVGSCTGAGGGDGEMDFSFRVDDEQNARDAVASIMKARMPGATYRVRVVE